MKPETYAIGFPWFWPPSDAFRKPKSIKQWSIFYRLDSPRDRTKPKYIISEYKINLGTLTSDDLKHANDKRSMPRHNSRYRRAGIWGFPEEEYSLSSDRQKMCPQEDLPIPRKFAKFPTLFCGESCQGSRLCRMHQCQTSDVGRHAEGSCMLRSTE
ncbi:predicted protein [Histoplasma capsulatum H143]|uniref:Uncharacterized protein n=1 Tax=Ajellomyces capsulatus (strain H143) TaxID=544712 RepID=C6HI22_AJECH|nr:predicted protein [Histoplasma capsulatum H143]